MRGIEQVPWLYDTCCALMERGWFGPWRRWLTGEARGRVLEVGSGTGRNLPLYPAGVRVIAIEPAWPSLRRGRERSPSTTLVQARAEALPFRDATFDTVVSGLVFCSVDVPARGVAEIRRVLRPGGSLRMIEHVRSTTPWKARLQDLLQPCWTRVSGGCHPNRETERAVTDAGFVIEPASRAMHGTMRRFSARPAS